MPDDPSTTVWMHAYRAKSPDEWEQFVQPSVAHAKALVLQRIAEITKTDSPIDIWNFSVEATPKPFLHACIRVSCSDATKLYNCKDSFLFFRPFISSGSVMPAEKGIVILWTKFETVSALTHLASTLQGIHGFVANTHSIGVRVELQHVHAARVLQKPNPRLNEVNRGIYGMRLFEVSGFPLGTTAAAVTTMLSTTSNDDDWKPWIVIPIRHIKRGQLCAWLVRADAAPFTTRVILGEGTHKIVINEMPTKSEMLLFQRRQKSERAEADKAIRRNKILEATLHVDPPGDPWQNWRGQASSPTVPAKGGGKAGKSSNKSAGTSSAIHGAPVSPEVQRLRRDLDALIVRVGQQDQKIDSLQNQMQSNHSEIMNAFRALGAGTSSSSRPDKKPSRKRSPEIANTPLKALADTGDTRRTV